MIDTLLQLGREQRIPVGIEYIDAAAFRSRISLREQNTSQTRRPAATRLWSRTLKRVLFPRDRILTCLYTHGSYPALS